MMERFIVELPPAPVFGAPGTVVVVTGVVTVVGVVISIVPLVGTAVPLLLMEAAGVNDPLDTPFASIDAGLTETVIELPAAVEGEMLQVSARMSAEPSGMESGVSSVKDIVPLTGVAIALPPVLSAVVRLDALRMEQFE